ncbi:MAG: septum formation initiator family protein [Actinobacteria bacterium]|jgi:cell division protein FtsB|nr:septum formation initiator family protein [Actinomycetota bacterium]
MENKFKVIGGLSRKAKINIAIAVTLLFMIITVFASIGQVKQIIEKREGITELEEKLSYYRNENIELLALEKSLYNEEGIELEARKQFNMTKSDEKNISVILKNDQTDTPQEDIYNDKSYGNNDLWGNIKIFYNEEIKD